MEPFSPALVLDRASGRWPFDVRMGQLADHPHFLYQYPSLVRYRSTRVRIRGRS